MSRPEAAGQPALGVAGLWLVVPVAVVLAVGAGGPETSVLVLAPLVTYGLPLVVMVAFWWNGWPGSRLRPGWSGLLDTVLVAAGAFLLTLLGQAAAAGGPDPSAVFDPTPGPGHVATFPAIMGLGGIAFIVMLQITLVSEKWPLAGLGDFAGGLAAVALSWVIALALDPLEIDGALLILIGAWQVAVYVAWGGRPIAALEPAWLRIVAGNALVLGGGAVTYLIAHELVGASSTAIGAVGGSAIAAGLVVAMLFEREQSLLALTLLTAALYLGLEAVAAAVDWVRATPDEWVAHAAMNAIGASVILHVAIGQRWPFAPVTQTSTAAG